MLGFMPIKKLLVRPQEAVESDTGAILLSILRHPDQVGLKDISFLKTAHL